MGISPRIEALDRLLGVTVFLTEDMNRTLADRGLTPARTHLLWELSRHGPMSQRALAGLLGISPSNVTGLVDGLVATGFVERAGHPTDRRTSMVTMTDKGRSADTLAREQIELAELLFADMPPDRLDAFLQALAQVQDRLIEATAAAAAAAAAAAGSAGPPGADR